MAVDFVESFDWAGSIADVQLRWGLQSSGDLSLVTGRQGGSTQAIRFSSASTGAIVEKAFGQISVRDNSNWMWGFAVRIDALPTTRTPIFGMLNTRRAPAMQLILDEAGFIHAIRDNDPTPFINIIGTSQDRLQLDTWHYIEILLEAATGNDGQMELRIDGKTTLLSITTAITVESLGSSSYAFFKTFNGMQMDIDDIYFGNVDGGAINNALLGDTNIECLIPSADGATNAWAFTGGASRWESVDEGLGASHDGDTSYVDSQTQGQEQLFAMTDLSTNTTNGVAHYVQASYVAKKESIGGRGAVPLVRQNSVERLAGTQLGAGQGGYVMTYEPIETDPDGDIAWTPTTVNAMEIGMQTERDDFFPSLVTE